MDVLVLAALGLQAVVDKGCEGAGKHGHSQRVQPHGKADGEQVRRKSHQQIAGHGQDSAGQEGLPAAQQVCRHAAGHFAEEADDVIHAFGQADLPQGEAPGRQQGHPYRIRDAQTGEKVGDVNAAKLLFQVEILIHGEHPFYYNG